MVQTIWFSTPCLPVDIAGRLPLSRATAPRGARTTGQDAGSGAGLGAPATSLKHQHVRAEARRQRDRGLAAHDIASRWQAKPLSGKLRQSHHDASQ
jgi:hypothetical protein